MTTPSVLLWLRRDLRLEDHAALAAALAQRQAVQPVFIFDTDILEKFRNPYDRRLTFLAQALCCLNAELRIRGGTLMVFHGRATEVIPALSRQWNAPVFAAEDYEPATRKRDVEVANRVPLHLVKDHLIFAPDEVLKSDGTAFKVFTPYANAWRAKLSPTDYGVHMADDRGRYAKLQAQGVRQVSLDSGYEGVLSQIGYQTADISRWPVADARQRLKLFIGGKVQDYSAMRDKMAEDGTSRLSPYVRFGLVSVREALRLAMAQGGADTWISELIWREFYAMILYHYPESTHQEWKKQWRGLKWSQDARHFAAWCEGRTGFPVVDAAMRQLLQEGWMHNRARMIVASFLTKDLQLDWRLGEGHFAQHLMDYELASNVGGWQWSASTGTDAQPWFRIFNPLLQSQKYDPSGNYIRRYVPELAHLEHPLIHNPPPLERGSYPHAMVDHAQAREKTLAMFTD